MRLVQTSLCMTIDCASSVLYCVIVCGCALVFSMASWNSRALWSSLYSPQVAIINCRFVTTVPFNYVLPRLSQVIDYCFVLFVYVGVQESRQVWDSHRICAEKPRIRQPSALSMCFVWINGVHGCRRIGVSVAFSFL